MHSAALYLFDSPVTLTTATQVDNLWDQGACLTPQGNADVQKGQRGPAAIPAAAVLAAQDLIAGCKTSTDEPLFAVVPVAAATGPGQKGWRLSEGVRRWQEWQEEEQLTIYRYWPPPFNFGKPVILCSGA